MRAIHFFIGVALSLAVSGVCLAQKVNVDYDKSANFQDYKTYAWVKGTPAKNQLMDQRIVNGVEERLTAKGFQKVSSDSSADLLVSYYAAVGTQAQLNTTNMGGYGWRWGSGMSTTTVQQIPVGELIVEIGDPKVKRVLWQGTATDTLSDKPEKNEKKINNALDDMFKKFPPETKKQ